jgi:hypothetical protein
MREIGKEEAGVFESHPLGELHCSTRPAEAFGVETLPPPPSEGLGAVPQLVNRFHFERQSGALERLLSPRDLAYGPSVQCRHRCSARAGRP